MGAGWDEAGPGSGTVSSYTRFFHLLSSVVFKLSFSDSVFFL